MMDANVLFRQLGGNRFRAMTGAKDFMKDGNSLRMKIMKNNTGGNHLIITLNSNDLYDMRFESHRLNRKTYELTIKVKAEETNIPASNLQRVFTELSGLYTRMAEQSFNYEERKWDDKKDCFIDTYKHGIEVREFPKSSSVYQNGKFVKQYKGVGHYASARSLAQELEWNWKPKRLFAESFNADEDDYCMTCGAKDKNPTSEGACDECVCMSSGCDSPKSGKSYSYCEICYEQENPDDTDYDKSGYYAEQSFNADELEFTDWANQEMKTHGKKESFDDWLDDELKSHGDNVSLQDWGHHELDSHYERYGAEGKRYPKSPNDEILDGLSEDVLRKIIYSYGSEIRSLRGSLKYAVEMYQKYGEWEGGPLGIRPSQYEAESFSAEDSGFNPVVLCKTCGYETTIMGWPRGKNKYTCSCEKWGDNDIVVICKSCNKETTYRGYEYGYCGCSRSKNAESFNAENRDGKDIKSAIKKLETALGKSDGAKYKMHDLDDRAEPTTIVGFEMSRDGEKYAGGSYLIMTDGSIVNAAMTNADYGNISDTVEEMLIKIKNSVSRPNYLRAESFNAETKSLPYKWIAGAIALGISLPYISSLLNSGRKK